MNNNIFEDLMKIIKKKLQNRRWRQTVTALACAVVFSTTYALILPAITMTKDHPSISAEEMLAWTGDELSVKIDAAAPAGEAEKTVVLVLEGENADLSASYVFNNEGICVVADDAGREIELHRSFREDKENAVDYWFSLDANEETSFVLELLDQADPDRYSEAMKAVRESKGEEPEGSGAATESNADRKEPGTASPGNAVKEEKGQNKQNKKAVKASASNATKASSSNADLADNIILETNDDGFVEILDGEILNDLEQPDEDEEEEQTEIVAEIKLSAGIGDDYESAVKDAEKNADKRGDAQLVLRWKDFAEKQVKAPKLVSSLDGAAIAVLYDENAGIPEGAELAVRKVEEGTEEYAEYLGRTQEALANKEEDNSSAEDAGEDIVIRNVARAEFFRIAILDGEGNEIDPGTDVKVIIVGSSDAEAAEEYSDSYIVRFSEEGAELYASGEKENDEAEGVTFITGLEPVYGIVGTETLTTKILTAAGGDFEIRVTCGPMAGIPKDAELKAAEISKESAPYEEYYKTALSFVDLGEAPVLEAARAFDLSILSDGQPVTPAEPVEVKITMERQDDKAEENDLVYAVVRMDGEPEIFLPETSEDSARPEIRFTAAARFPFMILGTENAEKAAGKIGTAKTENLNILKDRLADSAVVGVVPDRETMLEILEGSTGLYDGKLSKWYRIRNKNTEGYVQAQDISFLTELQGKLEAQAGDAKFTVEGMLPAGGILTVKKSGIEKEQLLLHFNPNDRDLIYEYWAYEIAILVDGKEWQPKEKVKITVNSPDIKKGERDLFGVAYIVDGMGEIEQQFAEPVNDEFSYETSVISLYAYYTADWEFAAGERVRGTNWMEMQYEEETDDEDLSSQGELLDNDLPETEEDVPENEADNEEADEELS